MHLKLINQIIFDSNKYSESQNINFLFIIPLDFKKFCDLFCCIFCRAYLEFEIEDQADTVKIHHRRSKHEGGRDDDKHFPYERKIILVANMKADNRELGRNENMIIEG